MTEVKLSYVETALMQVFSQILQGVKLSYIFKRNRFDLDFYRFYVFGISKLVELGIKELFLSSDRYLSRETKQGRPFRKKSSCSCFQLVNNVI